MRIERVGSTYGDYAAPANNAFVRKLMKLAPLSDREAAELALLSARSRGECAQKDLVAEDSAPKGAMILLEGFACRYRRTADGGRQILSFLVPGDLCDFDRVLAGRMDHAIGSLTTCSVAWVSAQTYSGLLGSCPGIASALQTAGQMEEAIMRDWLVGLGRRRAPERLAHLLCELLERMQAVGLADADGCDLPITQIELSDAAGLSPVHISRSLQALRVAGLVQLVSRRLQVLDLPRLQAFCEFSPMLERLGREPAPGYHPVVFGAA